MTLASDLVALSSTRHKLHHLVFEASLQMQRTAISNIGLHSPTTSSSKSYLPNSIKRVIPCCRLSKKICSTHSVTCSKCSQRFSELPTNWLEKQVCGLVGKTSLRVCFLHRAGGISTCPSLIHSYTQKDRTCACLIRRVLLNILSLHLCLKPFHAVPSTKTQHSHFPVDKLTVDCT